MDLINDSVRQARPRTKVYGRRRHAPLENRDANLQLFGGGGGADELEKAIAKLSVSERPQRPSQQRRKPSPEKAAQKQTNPTLQSAAERQHSPSPVRSTSPEPVHTQPAKAQRRSRIRKAALYKATAANLKPVLAFPRVESTVLDFESFCDHLGRSFDVTKLSEGSYSDCFVIKNPGKDTEVAVLKVIPFDCEPDPVSGIATDSQGFLREVKVLSALEPYHGFAQIRASRVVKGKMNKTFIEASRTWLECTTEDVDKTVDPATKYADSQMFGIIEMDFAGRDLELLTQPSAFQAYDAFWMTVILIANAERHIEFEHRDLHMSNICFKSGPTGRDNVTQNFVKSMTETPLAVLGLSGLEISIIDYTHSRMRDFVSGNILFNPDAPFNPTELEEYGHGRHPCDQMDTVIKADTWMRQQHTTQKPNESPPLYSEHTPKTNVIWLSHVLAQLTKHAIISNQYSSIKGSSATAKRLQAGIWKRLGEALDAINSSDLDLLPASAEDLLLRGIDKGWISKQDVDVFEERLNDVTGSS